jgi:hypothetical protein
VIERTLGAEYIEADIHVLTLRPFEQDTSCHQKKGLEDFLVRGLEEKNAETKEMKTKYCTLVSEALLHSLFETCP